MRSTKYYICLDGRVFDSAAAAKRYEKSRPWYDRQVQLETFIHGKPCKANDLVATLKALGKALPKSFVTVDGKEWDSAQEASDHESENRVKILVDLLRKWRDDPKSELIRRIVKFISERFETDENIASRRAGLETDDDTAGDTDADDDDDDDDFDFDDLDDDDAETVAQRRAKMVALCENKPEPKRRGRPPLSESPVEEAAPKRRGRPPLSASPVEEAAPKRRGRSPLSESPVDADDDDDDDSWEPRPKMR